MVFAQNYYTFINITHNYFARARTAPGIEWDNRDFRTKPERKRLGSASGLPQPAQHEESGFDWRL